MIDPWPMIAPIIPIPERNKFGYPVHEGPDYTISVQRGYFSGAYEAIMNCYDECPQRGKLARAQAIAAEVRARKFPPVVRITPKEI